MSDPFHDLLSRRGVLFADGAMGTSLFALGLETGDSPELWNVDRPGDVEAVHRGFIDAGADIILTNSFGANRRRLMLHGAQSRVWELNMAAAAVACRAADGVDRRVLVAGSMGPTGDLYAPVGPLTREEGEQAFVEQAEALAEGGVDLLWIETLSSTQELEAAASGAARTGLPIVLTMTFDTNGRTMMGVTPGDAVQGCAILPKPPAAIGANCGTGPSQLVATVLALAEAAGEDDVLVAKANCGIPEYRDGSICYSGTPDVMAEYGRLARDAGARIIGGCCGTTAEHLRSMIEAVRATPRGPRPDHQVITERLGAIAVENEAAGKAAAERRSDRRRRRG